MILNDKHIDKMVIASVLIQLTQGYKDFDEFMCDMYQTAEFEEAICDVIRWSIEYNNKHTSAQ